MYYNITDDRVDFNKHISTGVNNVYCNALFETSDKRLKENIEDVDEDCSDIVRKINVKTFNMKGDDQKKNHIGFIADELQELLPKKFEGVVDKNGGFLGVNYGKLTAVLLKAFQETLNKVEHLEASVYELQEELKKRKNQLQKVKQKQNLNLKNKM